MLVCIFIFGLFEANQVSSFILTPTQQCILKDFSWKLKVKILNDLLPNGVQRRGPVMQALVYSNTTRNHFNNDLKQRNVDIQYLTLRKNNVNLAKALKRNVAIGFLIKGPVSRKQTQRIDKDSSMSLDEKSDSKNLDFEAMEVHDGLQAYHNTDINKKKLLYRRQDSEGVNSPDHTPDEAETERNMKLKLFRLMYDTVKDNDELVRKADTIKKKYDNSSYFEIGFIMGSITDKVNTMSEVALTVERLHDNWKPIEHVNAYEQITNQAIEINHLVDILQSSHKKVEAAAKKEPAPPEKKVFNVLRSFHELKGT